MKFDIIALSILSPLEFDKRIISCKENRNRKRCVASRNVLVPFVLGETQFPFPPPVVLAKWGNAVKML